MLFRRNVVRHIRHGNAVWFDSGNANCRITGNVFADVLTVSAAVHMEMNRSGTRSTITSFGMSAMPNRALPVSEDARDRACSSMPVII